MDTRNKKELVHKLDTIIQTITSKKKCHYCKTSKGVVGHHLIRRADLMYRWDLNNILPVCMYCHRKIHDGFLKEPTLDIQRQTLKDYLLNNGLTLEDFMINTYEKLSGTKIEFISNEKSLIHKPKIKKEKSEFEINFAKRQKEYRKDLYQKLKSKYKKV